MEVKATRIPYHRHKQEKATEWEFDDDDNDTGATVSGTFQAFIPLSPHNNLIRHILLASFFY